MKSKKQTPRGPAKYRRGTPEYILKNRKESNERKRRLAKEREDFYKMFI